MSQVETHKLNGKSGSSVLSNQSTPGKALALFDFDGTITSADTLAEFIIFSKGRLRFYAGLVRLLPVLALYKLKLIPNWKAKEKLLSYFFKATDISHFQLKCSSFVKQRLPSLLRSSAMKKIQEHRNNGDKVIVVSASPENWVGEWAIQNGIEFISSRLEVKSGLLTGKLSGQNCCGEEKVKRIRQYLDLSGFETIHTYGDTADDWPMLKLGSKVSYKPFRA